MYDQAEKIAAKFGTRYRLAKLLGITPPAVYHWSLPRPQGNDGIVPSGMIPRLFALADMMGITLTPDDWFPGEKK